MRLAGWLALAALAGCTARGKAVPPMSSTDPTAQDYVGPALPHAQLEIDDGFGGVHRLEVEVAANGKARERGLMWRSLLPEGKGMLFIFPDQEEHVFWMKNTLIPLDMIFIARDGHVVGVVSNATPQTLTPRTVGERSTYVLEVPGTWAARMGVARGNQVRFQGLAMIPVTD